MACARLLVSADERKKRASNDKACERKTAVREKGSFPAVFAQLFSMRFSNILEPGTEATRSTHKKSCRTKVSPDIPLLNGKV